MDEPFRIERPGPAAPACGAVFSSPHSGRRFPPQMLRRARLSGLALRRSEDAYVERLFDHAPRCGAPLIHALDSRAYVDLNRAPDELDPALIEGVRAAGANPRVAAGLGVIPRIVAEGAPIYEGKLPLSEAAARLRRTHAPYHRALEGLLAEARAQAGAAVLIDCHSMPSDALRALPRHVRRPDIVLGDLHGAACGRWLTALAEEAFRKAGFSVVRNAPFAGGYITARHGRPSRGVHALQVEIDRGLYLDERRIEPGPAFDEIRAALRPVIEALCAAARAEGALAAE